MILLHRSPQGVIWCNDDTVFIAGERHSREAFRVKNQIDDVVLNRFYDIDVYIGALAREAINARGISVRASTGEPRSCRCDAGIQEMSKHPTLEEIVSFADPRLAFDMRVASDNEDGRAVARCTVCLQPWLFSWSGEKSTRYYGAREWALAMPYGKAEADVIVEGLRAGGEVQRGGGRSFTRYRGDADGFFFAAVEDGTGEERPLSEAELRDALAGEWAYFLPFVHAPFAAKLRAAVLGGGDAIGPLGDLILYGHNVAYADALAALLEWPAKEPTGELRVRMASEMTGNNLYHALLSAIGYGPNTAAVGRAGARLLEALVAVRGNEDIPDLAEYRKTFAEMNA